MSSRNCIDCYMPGHRRMCHPFCSGATLQYAPHPVQPPLLKLPQRLTLSPRLARDHWRAFPECLPSDILVNQSTAVVHTSEMLCLIPCTYAKKLLDSSGTTLTVICRTCALQKGVVDEQHGPLASIICIVRCKNLRRRCNS